MLQSKGALIPQQEAREIAITMATKFSGPIPPPNLLAEYEKVFARMRRPNYEGLRKSVGP